MITINNIDFYADGQLIENGKEYGIISFKKSKEDSGFHRMIETIRNPLVKEVTKMFNSHGLKILKTEFESFEQTEKAINSLSSYLKSK